MALMQTEADVFTLEKLRAARKKLEGARRWSDFVYVMPPKLFDRAVEIGVLRADDAIQRNAESVVIDVRCLDRLPSLERIP
jgi:hypothetical protein